MNFEDLLIKEVIKYPELYIMELPGYMNVYTKNEYYEKIATTLNKTLKTNASIKSFKKI